MRRVGGRESENLRLGLVFFLLSLSLQKKERLKCEVRWWELGDRIILKKLEVNSASLLVFEIDHGPARYIQCRYSGYVKYGTVLTELEPRA